MKAQKTIIGELGFGAGELEVVREASVWIGMEFPLSDKFSY